MKNTTYNSENKKITVFTDMVSWQVGHGLALMIYESTKKFPKEEKSSLTDQLRRAATSATSNMAEGFGRLSYKAKLQFYYHSHGSLTELKNQLLISRDVGYLNTNEFERLWQQSERTHQLLRALISKTQSIIQNS